MLQRRALQRFALPKSALIVVVAIGTPLRATVGGPRTAPSPPTGMALRACLCSLSLTPGGCAAAKPQGFCVSDILNESLTGHFKAKCLEDRLHE